MTAARLQLDGICKRYPAVVANDDVSLAVAPGELHALLGENGAGKSTLMKIVFGLTPPDAGSIRIDGRPLRVRNPREARSLGIAMVFQHFSLFDQLTVAENVWLGLDAGGGRRSLAAVAAEVAAVARDYGLEVEPARPVHTLSVGEMQRVEIVRALLLRPRLLILDEPTSVLTPQAVQRLFEVLRRLAAEGCSVLYISHKLDEARALCTACTVLRAGRVAGRCDPRAETNASLARLMIGAEPPPLVHHQRASGEVRLAVRALSVPRESLFGVDLEDVDFDLRAGEVLGVAGVSGNGQRELLALLSGEDRRAPPGSIRIGGEAVGALGPQQRRALGLHLVPEERLGRGAVPPLSLAQNLLLTRGEAVGRLGWLHRGLLVRQARRVIDRFGVKAPGPQAPAASLSGGNLQKFIVGREVDARPRILIVAQPTWGVDVGAAAQIRAEILALRDAGCAVLLVSEELEELFELSDRLVVMHRGRLSPPLARSEATVERVGAWMSGLWHEPVQARLAPVGDHAAA